MGPSVRPPRKEPVVRLAIGCGKIRHGAVGAAPVPLQARGVVTVVVRREGGVRRGAFLPTEVGVGAPVVNAAVVAEDGMVRALASPPALGRTGAKVAAAVVAAITRPSRARVAASRVPTGGSVGAPMAAAAGTGAATRVVRAPLEAIGLAMAQNARGVAGVAGATCEAASVGQAVGRARGVRREVARALVAGRPSLPGRQAATPVTFRVPFQARQVMVEVPVIRPPEEGVEPRVHEAPVIAPVPTVATSGAAVRRPTVLEGLPSVRRRVRLRTGAGGATSVRAKVLAAVPSAGVRRPASETLHG